MPSIVESFALQALLAGAADYSGDEVEGKAVLFGATRKLTKVPPPPPRPPWWKRILRRG
jgi:hypothetical protein